MYYVTFPVVHVHRDCARKLAGSLRSIPHISKIQGIGNWWQRDKPRLGEIDFALINTLFSVSQEYAFEKGTMIKSLPSIAPGNEISCTLAI